MNFCNNCYMSEKAEEDANHHFLHCLLLSIFGVTWAMPKSLLFCWTWKGAGKGRKKIWKTLPVSIWWVIWKERNLRCFEGKRENITSYRSMSYLSQPFGATWKMYMVQIASQILSVISQAKVGRNGVFEGSWIWKMNYL